MLLLPMLKKEENEDDDVDGLLPLWRKTEKQSVEREKYGGEDGGQVGGENGGGWRPRRREKEEREKCGGN